MQAGKISQQMHMVFWWVAGYMLWCRVDGVERQPVSRAHGAADGSVASARTLGPPLAHADQRRTQRQATLKTSVLRPLVT